MFDPTLAPEGKHVVSMFTQWVPHEWASKPDAAELDAYADRVIARVDAVAPGLHRLDPAPPGDRAVRDGARVRARSAATSSTASCRPTSCSTCGPRPGYADFRTPIAGLYQASSATHGGGGVTGIPGLNAAAPDHARSPAPAVAACVERAPRRHSPCVAAGMLLATAPPLAAADPVRLTIGVIGPIGSLDIAKGTSDAANEVWKLQYPTLTGFAVDDLETVPGIADAWTANADGHGYTYTLGAATWSDGKPVTAADVASSLRRGARRGLAVRRGTARWARCARRGRPHC